MKKLILIFFMVSFFSCAEKQEEKIPSVQSEKSFSDNLELDQPQTITLLPQVRAVAGEWLAYATAQNEIENIKGSSGLDIMNASGNLVQIMENLQTTIPDTLQSSAVEARTNVLYTKAQVLHQLSTKKLKNPDEIFNVAAGLVTEFDNFKRQLNELFLKTPENFETELDEEFEEALEPDSTGTIPLFRERDI